MMLAGPSFEYWVPVIAGTILFPLLAAFIIYFILLYRRSQTKLHLERERVQQELLRVENEVKEQTLLNVSRELHDNLGQVASLIKINMNMLSTKLSGNDLNQVNESLTLIKQLISDIKSLSNSLKGERLREIGWLESIEEEVRRANTIEGFKIEFLQKGASQLSHESELILFRIIQEILNNTLKHSRADKAVLKINCAANHTKISFEDNGEGFDVATVKRGSGLNNIQDRCEMIHAEFEISSGKKEGTQISINLSHQT
ncbi:MAG: sensor histidine kinase [Crocinitomicaceae bacterium]